MGYWENWNDTNYNKNTFCTNTGCADPDKFREKTKYYDIINWSFVLLSSNWYGGYPPDGGGCGNYMNCGEQKACPACLDSNNKPVNIPTNALYTIANCRTNPSYPPFINTSITKNNVSNYPDLLVARDTCKLAHDNGKKFNISFGGWSDCITLNSVDSNLVLADLISKSILFTFSDGVDLDFEHFTQLSPLTTVKYPNILAVRSQEDRTKQLVLFADLVNKIRTNIDNITDNQWNDIVNSTDYSYKTLLNNKPKRFTISFTSRYNSFIPFNSNGDIYSNNLTSGEGIQLINIDKNFLNNIDYINLMIYDTDFGDLSKDGYGNIYENIINKTISAGISSNKIFCGVEPGIQAGSDTALDQTSSIKDISNIITKKNLAGIFFWAINEKPEVQKDFSIYISDLFDKNRSKPDDTPSKPIIVQGGGGGLCTPYVTGSSPCAQGKCVNGHCICTNPACQDKWCNC